MDCLQSHVANHVAFYLSMEATVKVVIIGGGFVGWLAGWLRPDATVLDWRAAPVSGRAHVPRMLGAMYLHEPLEGLPSRSFPVRTTIDGQQATYDTAARYKLKVGKPTDMESSTWMDQFPMLSIGHHITEWPSVNIRYGVRITRIDPLRRWVYAHRVDGSMVINYDLLVSAIPLPALMEMLHEPMPTPLVSCPIAIRSMTSPPDVPSRVREFPETMFIDYRADEDPIYRVTDFQGVRYYEWLRTDRAYLGLPTKVIHPGKLYPAEWTVRYVAELRKLGIHCVGRPARWAPNELLHESYRALWDLFRHPGA
jgi:hypothetical protein